MTVHIGTSGYAYIHWKNRFYPKGLKSSGQFGFFCEHFRTVELNVTFYNNPTVDVVRKWRDNSPEDFTFSVKANKWITHLKKLNDPSLAVDFVNTVSNFGDKLGAILFQLPPRWNVNVDRLGKFLEHLPPGFSYTFEFRNQTWLRNEVYELLRQHKVGCCIYDFNRFLSPEVITSDPIYLRFHGPGAPYADPYSAAFLDQWAARILQWHRAGHTVYCYFDNDNQA